MSDWIGRTLSKVEIKELIGKGGMAEVFLGHHTTLNRPMAVKVLLSHLTDEPDLQARFSDEAQSVAAMRHPHIIQVFDYDIVEDRPYMVMELITGTALDSYLNAQHKASKLMPPEMVAYLIQGLAQALDYAHARSIVHRDIKPANVMLRRESGTIDIKKPLPSDVTPVLMDFGVARMASATGVRTATGAMIGTPAYMSPEQVRGEPVDARSDIYSLGIMVYEMIAGQPPFDPTGETPASLLFKHALEEPPPLPEDVSTPEIQAVMDKSLAKDPADRYQSAGEMSNALSEALGQPTMQFATPAPPGRIDKGIGLPEKIDLGPLSIPVNTTTLAAAGGAVALLLLVLILAVAGVFGGGQEVAEETATPIEAASPTETIEPTATEVVAGLIGADNALSVKQVRQFKGAQEQSYGLAFSPDNQHVAVFGINGPIRVYEAATGDEVGMFEGHVGGGYGMTYTPDGSQLISSGDDFRIYLWDVESGNPVYNFEAPTQESDVAVSPDGQLFAVVGATVSRVHIYEIDGTEYGIVTEHSRTVHSAAFSPDGTLLATGNARGNIIVTDVESLATEVSISDGSGVLFDVAFSPDGSRLAAASGSGDIFVWTTSDWMLESSWRAHEGGVQSLAWSNEGDVIISGGVDGRLVLWNANTGRELQAIQHSDGTVWKIALSSDGTTIAILGGNEAIVHVFQTR